MVPFFVSMTQGCLLEFCDRIRQECVDAVCIEGKRLVMGHEIPTEGLSLLGTGLVGEADDRNESSLLLVTDRESIAGAELSVAQGHCTKSA